MCSTYIRINLPKVSVPAAASSYHKLTITPRPVNKLYMCYSAGILGMVGLDLFCLVMLVRVHSVRPAELSNCVCDNMSTMNYTLTELYRLRDHATKPDDLNLQHASSRPSPLYAVFKKRDCIYMHRKRNTSPHNPSSPPENIYTI